MPIETLKRYNIIRQIGQGATGKVFLASDRLSGRYVALKTLDVRQAMDLRKEFLVLSGLHHPNLCTMLDFGYAGQAGESPYLVREYVPGRDLGACLGELSREVQRSIAVQLLRALAYLHRQGIIHGDVKPANILLTPANRVKLIDFHLALAPTGQQRGEHTGGTVAYLSPERLAGKKKQPDPGDDLFALGMTLCQCIIGRLPMPSMSPEGLAAWYRDRPCLFPSAWLDQVDPALDRLVSRLTAIAPGERFGSTKEAIQSLGESEAADPQEPGWVRFAGRDAEREQLGNTLPHDVLQDKGPALIWLTGPSGSGKTRLLNAVLPRIKTTTLSVYAVWASAANPLDSLLTQLPADVRAAGQADPVGALISFFAGRPACIVFDHPDTEKMEEFLFRVTSKPDLKLMLLVTLPQGAAVPEINGRHMALPGLSLEQMVLLVKDYMRCDALTDSLAKDLWHQTGGLPGPLLALLKAGMARRVFSVNEAGQLMAVQSLPKAGFECPDLSPRMERLAAVLLQARGPLDSEVLKKALGPDSALLLGEACEKGLAVTLETGGHPLVVPAWGVSLENAGTTVPSRNLAGLRLALAYAAFGCWLEGASVLSALGMTGRALDWARTACRRHRSLPPEKSSQAWSLLWSHARGAEKVLAGFRGFQQALDQSDMAGCKAWQDALAALFASSEIPRAPILRLLFEALQAQWLRLQERHQEAADRLDQAITLCDDALPGLPSLRVELLALKGSCDFQLGYTQQAADSFEQVAAAPGPPSGSVLFRCWCRAQSTAATGFVLLGDRTKAAKRLKRILSFKTLAPSARIQALGELAIQHAERGERDKALALFRQLADTAETAGDRQAQIKAVLNQAILAYKIRHLSQAKQCFNKALSLSLASGELMLRPAIWCGTATVNRVAGDFRSAIQLFWKVLRLPRIRANFRINAACNLGEVYHLSGAVDKALSLRRQAVEEAESLGDEYLRLLCWFGLLSTEVLADTLHAETVSTACGLSEKRGDPRLRAGIQWFLGLDAEAAGRDDKARQFFGRALGAAVLAGDGDYRAGALLGLMRCLLRAGRLPEASHVLARIQEDKGRTLCWELAAEGRLWSYYLAAQKGGAARAVLGLTHVLSELSQSPALMGLACFLLAGLMRTIPAAPYAWVAFYQQGMDWAERLHVLGAAGVLRHLRTVVRGLYPALWPSEETLKFAAMPWSFLSDLRGSHEALAAYRQTSAGLRLICRHGGPIPRGRAYAAAACATGQPDRIIHGAVQVARYPEDQAVLVLKDRHPPAVGWTKSLLILDQLCQSQSTQCLSSLKWQDGAPIQDHQKETDLIQSRAAVVETVRQAARVQPRESPRFVGASRVISRLIGKVPQISGSDLSILLTGESGTGKDLLAETIHRFVGQERPFVPLHCGSLPEPLLEAELFGVTKGAFTGATEDRVGLLTSVAGGTLYLDGVDGLSESLQVKLLRVLENRTVRPVGGSESIPIQFRLMSASRLDADALRQHLRDDFFYRINGFLLGIPPLREHTEDIPTIVEELLRRWHLKNGKQAPRVTPDFLTALSQHNWPGNVRELENLLARILVKTPKVLTQGDLPLLTPVSAPSSPPSHAAKDQNLKAARESAEREYLHSLLQANQGKIGVCAKQAGISRRHLLTLLKKYNIPR